MSPKHFTTVYLTVTSASDPMSMDNNYGFFLIIAPIETYKPSSQPASDTSYYSSSTPRTDSTSVLFLVMHYLLI